MNILIVGGRSHIGKALARNANGRFKILTAGRSQEDDIFFDLSSPFRSPTEVTKCDVLVHCAASFESDGSLSSAIQNELTNSVGAFRIVELAEAVSCKRILYLSTIASIGHSDNQYFGSYGLSKGHGQGNLEFGSRLRKINVCTLQLGAVYGAHADNKRHQGLLHLIVQQAAKGEDVTIFGSVDPLRNYIHVEDVSELLIKLTQSTIVGSFPVVHPKSYALSEIARMAFDVFGCGGKVKFDRARPSLGTLHIPNDHALYDLLGWSPQISLERGLRMIKSDMETKR